MNIYGPILVCAKNRSDLGQPVGMTNKTWTLMKFIENNNGLHQNAHICVIFYLNKATFHTLLKPSSSKKKNMMNTFLSFLYLYTYVVQQSQGDCIPD